MHVSCKAEIRRLPDSVLIRIRTHHLLIVIVIPARLQISTGGIRGGPSIRR
jgi:hypothetical protein